MAEIQLLDPRAERASHELLVEIRPGVGVRCRREDMAALLFDGRVPMPMLQAVQRMVTMAPTASPLERVEALGEHSKSFLDLLRQHAVDVAVQPRIVLTDTGDPTTMPVAYLTLQELMTIWNATALVPGVTASQADTFRAGAAVVAPDVVAPVEGVQPPPVLVDQSPEFVTG